jgi:hypothetical protein
MLDRAAILAFASKAAFPAETVAVPELGGDVRIRSLSGAERDQFERDFGDRLKRPSPNVRAHLAALCLCDGAGERIFRDADVEALGELPGAALDRVFDAARRLSGLAKDDVEALEKN